MLKETKQKDHIMMCLNSVRAVTVVSALFLCPISSKGMELNLNLVPKGKAVERVDNSSDTSTYVRVNKELNKIRLILGENLGFGGWFGRSNTFKHFESGEEYAQCNLSKIPSTLISGDWNKPLRDDLRTLLYKPQTDLYYAEHLSRKDFTLLAILKKAICDLKVKRTLDGGSDIELSLNEILSLKNEDASKEKFAEHSGYRDLFIRRRLDEINRLFKRAGMQDKEGNADVLVIPCLNDDINGIHLMLSKAYMMHMLKDEDKGFFDKLDRRLFGWEEFDKKVDTYAQWRLKEIFSELKPEFKKNVNFSDRVLHCTTLNDLNWLKNCGQYLNISKRTSFQEDIFDLKKDLRHLLNRGDYLKHFALYRERSYYRDNHRRIFNFEDNELKDANNQLDLFVELSQLRVSLNSLGNGKDRSVTGAAQTFYDLSPEGPQNWVELQERVDKVKSEIDTLRSKILFSLEEDQVLSVQDLISKLMEKEKRRQEAVDQKEEVWILSLNGGGVRGKIGAETLRDLSHRLKNSNGGQKLQEIFDFSVGTSVGGLIALSMNLADENGDFAVDEDYIAELLEQEKASIIFPQKNWLAKLFSQSNSNAYEAAPLENLLLAHFGFTPLSEMVKPTMVMAHSNKNQNSVGFNSLDTSTDEIITAGGALSTTAAPTYLSAVSLCYDGKLEEFVDGGMTANNPVYDALDKYLEMRNFNIYKNIKRVNVLSIGTGNEIYNHPHGTCKTGLTGVLENLQGTMGKTMGDAHMKTVLYLGGLILKEVDVSYYVLDPILHKKIELDSATEENISKLRSLFYEKILPSSSYDLLIRHLLGDSEITKNQYVYIGGGISDRRENFADTPPYIK